MKISELRSSGTINKDNAREYAVKFVDNACQRRIGFSIHDLPDTPEIASVYDEVEDMILEYIQGEHDWDKKAYTQLMNETFSEEQLKSMIFG